MSTRGISSTWLFLLINVGIPLIKHIIEEAPDGMIKDKLKYVLSILDGIVNI